VSDGRVSREVSYVDSSSYGVSQLRVTSEYSGRAAVFREELQSYRRTDPAILVDRQRVKIQCEDSASVIVNCSEL
jgi:hypothetical protein